MRRRNFSSVRLRVLPKILLNMGTNFPDFVTKIIYIFISKHSGIRWCVLSYSPGLGLVLIASSHWITYTPICALGIFFSLLIEKFISKTRKMCVFNNFILYSSEREREIRER